MKSKRLTRVNNQWLDIQAKMTPVSLDLPKNLSYEQWAEIGPRIARIKRFTSWALSDWLNYGERKYGETYSQAVEATRFDPNYLAIIKYVGSRVDASRRRESLSFSHHRLIAPLEPEQQEQFLSDADKNSWTRDEMKEAVREFEKKQRQAISDETAPPNLQPAIDGQRKMRGIRWGPHKSGHFIYELRIGPTAAGMRIRELREEMEAREAFRFLFSEIEEMENEVKRLRAKAEELEKKAREARGSYRQEVWQRLEEEHGEIRTGTEVYSVYVHDPELHAELAKLGKKDAERIAAILLENWASGKLQCVARTKNDDVTNLNALNFSLPDYEDDRELPEGFPSTLPSGRVGWTGIGNEAMRPEDE